VSRATEQVRPAQTSADEGGSFAARRYYDQAHGSWIVKVLPGEFYVTPKSDEVIATILGSCVSACIRDRHAGIGGSGNQPKSANAEARQAHGQGQGVRIRDRGAKRKRNTGGISRAIG